MKRKNDVSYHMTWETQDHDFTCSCKNAPIPMASVLHSHDGYEIYLFLSGEIRIIFENDNRIMKRGDLLLIPPVCLSFCSTGRQQYLQPRRHQHQGILHAEKKARPMTISQTASISQILPG